MSALKVLSLLIHMFGSMSVAKKEGKASWLVTMCPWVRYFFQEIGVTMFDIEDNSSNNYDPLKYVGNEKLATACSALEAIRNIRNKSNKVTIPVLMCLGKKDKITPYKWNREFYDQLGSTKKQIIEVEGRDLKRHEPFDL